MLVISTQAGLRRQDAGANIGAADGPKGERRMRRVIQRLAFNDQRHWFPDHRRAVSGMMIGGVDGIQ